MEGCLDCGSPTIPCDCRPDCPGTMCSNPKCNETIDMTVEQREAHRALVASLGQRLRG